MTNRKKKDENRISIIVVDDHPGFREGVVDEINSHADFQVIDETGLGDYGLALIRDRKPQVAILDSNLPGMSGFEIMMNIVSEKLPTRVIFLTGYSDDEQALYAVVHGAKGYFSKEIAEHALVTGIRAVADGKYAIGENIFDQHELDAWMDEQIEGVRKFYSKSESSFHPLSDLEMDVLSYVARGMSNKEIGGLLGISHQTVKNRVTSILRKFNVEDRTQAVIYALKRGWVKLQDSGIKSQN